MTGCAFSKDGTDIASTALNDSIYVYDTNVNFEKDLGVEYRKRRVPR